MKTHNCIRWTAALLLSAVLFNCDKPPRRDYFEAVVGEDTLQISLERESDTLGRIMVRTFRGGEVVKTSTFRLPYPIYRFDAGDLTGNGIPDIAVGVIKTARFDPKMAKRPFLFKITEEGDVRKLWMGSRVSQPLEDFALTKGETPARVMTIERERSGKFLVAVYRYHGFGLEHVEYVKREIPLEEAYKILRRGKP